MSTRGVLGPVLTRQGNSDDDDSSDFPCASDLGKISFLNGGF